MPNKQYFLPDANSVAVGLAPPRNHLAPPGENNMNRLGENSRTFQLLKKKKKMGPWIRRM